jgi:hypothetical protein
MRRTRYYHNYGYISGDGIFDSISDFYNSLSKLPDPIKASIRESALDIGKKGIKAVGSKLGDELADLITKKNRKKPDKTKTVVGNKTEEDIRREVLEDLKIIPKNSKKVVYGEGIRYL